MRLSSICKKLILKVPRRSRASVLACLSSGLPVFLVFLIPMIFGLVFYEFDFSRVTLPFWCEFKQKWQTSESFWISSFMGNGEPFLANPHSQFFYPVRWLFLPFSPDTAAALDVAVHLALAASGAAWLARTFRASWREAAICGWIFVFSGTVLDLIRHSTYIVGAAWLPWMWAASRRSLRDPDRRAALAWLGGSSLGLLLGGEPQAFSWGLGLCVLEIVLSWKRKPGASASRNALTLIIVLLSIGTASVFWIPIWQEARLTARSSGLGLQEALQWPIEKAHLFATLWPGFILELRQGHINTLDLLHGNLSLLESHRDGWNNDPYLGFLWTGLLAVALFRWRTRSITWVWIFAFLLSLGSATPLLPALVKWVPGFSSFRYPEKYFVLVTLASAVLATSVLRSFRMRWKNGAEGRPAVLKAWFFFLILNLLAWLAVTVFAARLDGLGKTQGIAVDPRLPVLSQLLHSRITHATIMLGLVLGIAYWIPRMRKVIPFLIVLDLLWASAGTLQMGDSILKGFRSAVANVSTQRASATPWVFCHQEDLSKISFATQDGSDDVFESTLFMRNAGLPLLNACDGVISATPYSPLSTEEREWLQHLANDNQLSGPRGLGCTHFITVVGDHHPLDLDFVPSIEIAHLSGSGAEPGSTIRALILPDPIPMSFVSKNPRWSTGFTSTVGRHGDVSSAALIRLIDDPLHRLGIGPAALPKGDSAGPSEVRISKTDHWVVDVAGKGSAIVGVRTVFAAGWTARQGPHEVPVIRVGGVHLGAKIDDVSAGAVEFVYQPPGLGPLSIAFSSGCFVCLLLLLFTRRKQKGAT